MSKEDWKLGESLDALSDMFYGGYAIKSFIYERMSF